MVTPEVRALWYPAPGEAKLESVELPPPEPGWCQIESHFSAVSPGTERLVREGQVPAELVDDMRCPYLEGSFAFPIKYGYSLVGQVTQGPSELENRFVHVLHPHQDHCNVRVEDALLIPFEVPPARATLASNLETAVNAIWDSDVTIGERALVVGFGIVGSLVARLLDSIAGVEVMVIDVDPSKLALADKLGFAASLPGEATSRWDLAFHASGAPAGLQTALDRLAFEGRVVELSWYGEKLSSLRLGGRFHRDRLRIISSQVSSIGARQRSRWTLRRRRQLALSLLADPAFDLHLTRQTTFEDLPTTLTTAGREGLATLVTYIHA